jgi:hypothetical protein
MVTKMDNPKIPPPKLTIVSSSPGKGAAPTPDDPSKPSLGVSQFPRFRDHTAEQSEHSTVIAPGGIVLPKKPLK